MSIVDDSLLLSFKKNCVAGKRRRGRQISGGHNLKNGCVFSTHGRWWGGEGKRRRESDGREESPTFLRGDGHVSECGTYLVTV